MCKLERIPTLYIYIFFLSQYSYQQYVHCCYFNNTHNTEMTLQYKVGSPNGLIPL